MMTRFNRVLLCVIARLVFALICAPGVAAPALDDPENAKVLTKPGTTVQHDDVVLCVAFSPDGKRVASAGADKALKLWDAHTSEQASTLKDHNDAVVSVSLRPDCR